MSPFELEQQCQISPWPQVVFYLFHRTDTKKASYISYVPNQLDLVN